MPQSKTKVVTKKVVKTTKASTAVSADVKVSKVAKETKLKVADKSQKVSPKATTRTSGLGVQSFDITGKSQGIVNLPSDLFGQKVNENLLAQAMRVYFTNQGTHKAHAKTRSEVRGGGKKPWRQKGTGRARAGSTRSPIWVGGGKALGPRFRDVKLALPKKMRRKALTSALSSKAKDGQIRVITNMENQEIKTKIFANLLTKLEIKGRTLMIVSKPNQKVILASRNIPGVSVDTFSNLNAFEIMNSKEILLSKDVIKG